MFTITEAAQAALRRHCQLAMRDEAMLPFVTWEILPEGGKWIVGFIEKSRLDGNALISSSMVDGIELVIDGPNDRIFLLKDSQLNFENGRYFFSERS